MWFFKENQVQTKFSVKLRRYKDGKFIISGKTTESAYFPISRTVFKKGKYLIKIKRDLFEAASTGLVIYLTAKPSDKTCYFNTTVQNDLFSYNAQNGIFEIYEDTQCYISCAAERGYNNNFTFCKTFEVNIRSISL